MESPVAPRRFVRSVLVALVASLQVFLGLPRIAGARVDPISIISRQIHKVNILVVLDTSGSMTSVPGGDFTSATETGIDCDNGVDCRGWGTPGGCTPEPPCSETLGNGCP